MNRTARWLAAALVAAFAADAFGGESGTVVLDSSGFWRVHYTIRKPLIGEREAELGFDTPPPPKDWVRPEFDDSPWRRIPGPPFPPYSNWSRIAKENVGWVYADNCSPGLALLCLRGKFVVKDPATARLRLSASYRGGMVAYVNGVEVARSHVGGAKGDLLAVADAYPEEAFFDAGGSALVANRGEKDEKKVAHWAKRRRAISDVQVPASSLRKGLNVLALEVHRAPQSARLLDVVTKLRSHEQMHRLWSTCGLVSMRLAAGGPGTEANATRPTGLQAWNSDAIAPDFGLDWGDPNEALRPVRIVGARNGVFSGKVVLGSREPLRGLKAEVTDLKSSTGGGIPASAVRVRWAKMVGTESYAAVRYVLSPGFFQALADQAPEEVPVYEAKRDIYLRPWMLPGTPGAVFGAVQPVWITVKVPADAGPGLYEGTVTVKSAGNAPVKAAVELAVHGYRLASPDDRHTWVDLIQSPESVAMKYGVPFWSDRHFDLIAKSLEIAGELGDKSVYINLIAESNQGNAQTMVRWVRAGDGWKHDFTPLDRYLDLVAKHMGNPELVCLYIWDTCLAGGHRDNVTQGAEPKVSKLDPASGKVETVEAPRYTSPEGVALWRPVLTGVRDRLKRRGWEKAMVFGIAPDSAPSAEVIKELGGLLPGVRWMRQGHSSRRNLRGAPIAYQALVWTPRFPSLPDCSPAKGWKRPDVVTQFIRSRSMFPLVHFRLMCEMNVAGTQRGVGRIGIDFWPVLKDKRGRLRGSIQGRYPATNWRNLDWMLRAFAHPGPDGAMPTCRSEMMREGIQECEACIDIEKALDAGRLSGDLKRRCEEFIGERTRMLRIALDNHFVDGFAKDAGHSWWSTPGQLGYQWYMCGVWQESSARLYRLATEVAAATGAIPRADAVPPAPAARAAGTGTSGARRRSAPARAARPPRRRETAPSDEERARGLWLAAENFLRNDMEALARRKFGELLKKYPRSEHAARAREKLRELGDAAR